MRQLSELTDWDRLLKRILWTQLGDIKGKKILDFGSGEGITANYYAKDNEVVAVEPWEEMLQNRWQDYDYVQLQGDISAVAEMQENSFDMVFCHNVLEYIDDKEQVVKKLCRVLKPGGVLSIVKHNRAGRVMQMAVLLDDFDKAHDLLDGKDSAASKFGAIRYYEDNDVERWAPSLRLEKNFGIRTFWDLQQKQEKHGLDEWQEKMIELELRVSQMEEYRNIAFFHHLVFGKE